MKKRKSLCSVLFGYALFFMTIAVSVTVAVTVYVSVSQRSGGNRNTIAAVMLAVILFLSLVCTLIDLIRRKFTVERPVKKILEGTDRIATGDFTVRLVPEHTYNRYDEYDYIMENLNKMAAELSKNELLRNDFISNVSHEMKTPLAIIQSYAASILSGKLDEETRNSYAATLVSTTKRLTDLVVNILRLNKLENQEIRSERKKIRLDEMLAEAVLRYEEKIEEKGLALDCELEEVTVYSLADYLEIIWNNLLSNAVKFTDCGGKLHVAVKKREGKAVVKISDTGCGISRETGEHIFEKFYQGDVSRSREGNGLGLALVKKVIDILGGEISVESEVGKGSTFTVVLHEGEE